MKIKNNYLIMCLLLLSAYSFGQEQPTYTEIGSTIKYKLIGTYDINRLNTILSKEIPELTGVNANYSPAKNAVKLYRVEYRSVIPEQNNRPTTASGLIAIPATGSRVMPLLSYQHGTVYGKEEVPSFPEKSFETRLVIAQFAGQGYAVIAADYFGMGTSNEKNSYLVHKSQQQACYDMYEASKVILANEQIKITEFFIAGWSQGGIVTMDFLNKLEDSGVKLKAASTASAPCDGFIMTNGFLNFPRKIDAPWITTTFILSAFSFEEYYKIPGLAQGLFKPEFYEVSKRLYSYDATIKSSDIPTDLRQLIKPEFFDTDYFNQSIYGKLLSDTHPYRWVIKTPVRMFYGEIDEAVTIGLARLPMDYQKAMGNNMVEAISTGANTHRMTFANAVPQWKTWFDSLSNAK
jgi:pimeloyl-ACP methyl ester carboxylesterase